MRAWMKAMAAMSIAAAACSSSGQGGTWSSQTGFAGTVGVSGFAGTTGSGTGTAGSSSGFAGSGFGGSGFGGSGFGGSSGAAGHAGSSGGGQTVVKFRAVANRNVDVVFMIDNSTGMSALQSKFIQQIPAYFNVLENLPGGLPNLHIGVVSSSMGAGRATDIERCPQGGDQGIFQSARTGNPSCATASLNQGQSYIVSVNGQNNFTGDIADNLACISQLGSGGCGFEHQFESVLRALGADGATGPAQNNGFLRADAFLQVVLLTDEDDCSAPPNSDLFDTSSQLVSDPLGPLQSFRCNEFGHRCGGKPPPRTPVNPPVDLSGTCVSAEDGRLLRVADVVTALKVLKSDPSKVYVSAVAAPATPYIVDVGPAQVKTDPSMWPFVEHSCMGADGVFGDPAVRIQQWVNAFGANGRFETLCAGSLGPALEGFAAQIGQALGQSCLPANASATTCSFVDQDVDNQGRVISTSLPACAGTADPGPCWTAMPGTAACPSGQSVTFQRPTPPSATLTTTATCSH
jgi:hypothetical protein